jgi:hypothetical protein
MSGYYPFQPFMEPDDIRVFKANVGALLRDREAFTVVDGLFDMSADLRAGQERILARVREVREQVEGMTG